MLTWNLSLMSLSPNYSNNNTKKQKKKEEENILTIMKWKITLY